MRALLVTLCIMISSLGYANSIAVVVRSSGDVLKIDSQQISSPLQRRDVLIEGDSITTGKTAYVTLKFADQTVLDLGENSRLVITQFTPPSNKVKGQLVLELLSGGVRTISGSIGKVPGAFELRTQHASIGIRGTEFEVLVISASETQVQRFSGNVLVRSLEFLGQEIELNESAQKASVTLGGPAQLIDQLSQPGQGPFAPDLLQLINTISAPPLILPIAPAPSVPLIVPLSANGNTPVLGVNNQPSLEPIETLVALVNQQQWPAARILANELQDRFEGLPRFDLYFGLLLMAEGNFNEAIFAFERVLVFAPDQHRARLELGRAYFATANYARARTELEQVLMADPPANVKQNVRSLLNQLDVAQQRAQSKTEFGGTALAGWDSNANSGSNLKGELAPNLLGLTELADMSKPLSSGYVQWSVTTGLTEPVNQFAASRFSADFTQKNYLDSSLNDSAALTLSATINGQSDRWRQQTPFSAQWSWLDGQSWQATVTAGATEQYRLWGPLWAGVKIGTQMSIALNDANISNAKDLAGIVFDAQERGRVHSFSSLYLQTMQAGVNDGHVEWRGLANRYQLFWTLPWNIQASFAAEHQWQSYKDVDLFFTVNAVSTELKRRQDQVISAQLQGAWSPVPWLQAQTSMSWERVDSNINAYSRDRMTISQALSVRF